MTTMNNEQTAQAAAMNTNDREEFETWFKSGSKSELARNCDGYKFMPASVAWTTWQAARAQPIEEKREVITWIPVSERLPDSDMTVQLFNAAADEPVWLGYLAASDNCWYYVDAEVAEPTHWAEMPAGIATNKPANT